MPTKNNVQGDLWTIIPRDTLVIGDGRPVGNTGGVRSLEIPWPSTLAGLVRHRCGVDSDGIWRKRGAEAEAIKQVAVRGPWLKRWNGDGVERLFPAPRDAVWHTSSPTHSQRTRLTPVPLPEGCEVDAAMGTLAPLQPTATLPEGKASGGPLFWTETELLDWLQAPVSQAEHEDATFGLKTLLHEQRIHVAIDPLTGTASDGLLFSTDGLRFHQETGEQLGLGFWCDDERLSGGVCVLGGERRISILEPGSATSKSEWTTMKTLLSEQERFRVVLLTPAIFTNGAVPGDIFGAPVVAAAVGRPQVISGWDYATNAPKPTRRMAPAGSVYWVEPDDPAAWVKRAWLRCCSNEKQDRLDGFGLCAVGVA